MNLKMSRCCTFLSVALLSTVTTAQAPPPADAAASAAEMLVLPGDRTLPITMTLLPRGLKSGRDEAAFNNYRPLVLFSGEDEPLSCALRIPDPPDKIEPGQTLDIGLRCIEDFRVRPGQPGFKMYEGSRLVGEGQLRGLR